MDISILLGLVFFVTSTAEKLPNGCPSDIHVHRLLPHESECSKFYQCSNGRRIEMNCGIGTVFNPVISVCDWPQAVVCPAPATEATTEVTTAKETNTPLESTTTDLPIINGTEATTENTAIPNTTAPPIDNTTRIDVTEIIYTSSITTESIGNTTEESISVETTTEALCPIGAFGNIAHPYLCDTFFMCVGGNAIQLYCSTGFEYDTFQQQCVAIKEGGCTDLLVQGIM